MNNEIMSAAHGSGLTYPSMYKICKYYADEADWNGKDADYWKAEAKYYQHCLSIGIRGSVCHPTIERQLEKDADKWKILKWQPQHGLS